MNAAHILAVNREIAKVKGLTTLGEPYRNHLRGINGTLYNWMESWHDAGPLVEEMGIACDSVVSDCSRWKAWLPYSDRITAAESDDPKRAICYAYLRSRGVENPERLGVEWLP